MAIDIARILAGRPPCITISTTEESDALAAIADAAVNRGIPLQVWSVVRGITQGIFTERTEPVADENTAAKAIGSFLNDNGQNIFVCCDLLDHLDNPILIRAVRELIQHCREQRSTLILIDYRSDWPAAIRQVARPIDLPLPNDKELYRLATEIVRQLKEERAITVQISRESFKKLTKALRGLTRTQAQQIILEVCLADEELNKSDIAEVVAAKQQLLTRDGLLQQVPSDSDLNHIGGFNRLKHWLDERRDLPGSIGAARGMLLLGVPGAGKSLCARAVAGTWERPLLRLDAGNLYDRYIGESERRLREALQQVEALAPVVLWIDEIEKGFAGAASHSTDGGLSQRMFGTLLTWMQEHRSEVFLVATANDIAALPPELLRKGRFDEIFFVDLPTENIRQAIWRIHLKRFKIQLNDEDQAALLEASTGYSGAEIAAAVQAARVTAHRSDRAIAVADLLTHLKVSPPLAITMAEQVTALREWADGRAVPVDDDDFIPNDHEEETPTAVTGTADSEADLLTTSSAGDLESIEDDSIV